MHGRVLDESGRPVPNTLVEFWQANAGGRYRHKKDTYLAPIDPNFGGCGRALTDDERLLLLPHRQARRLSVAQLGQQLAAGAHPLLGLRLGLRQRLITQMYFEGDPLIPQCPIVPAIPDKDAIEQLIAPLDLNAAIPLDSLAYKFDIVLRGRRSTLFENRLEGN